MLGDLIRYAANRAVGGAVDSATRHATWTAAAAFLLAVGTVFGLIVAFWLLDARYDAPTAGLAIAVSCFVVGALCLAMPRLLNWMEEKAKAKAPSDPVAETVTAVEEEVAEAVDYFGPIRVVGSALMLGVGIARSIKR